MWYLTFIGAALGNHQQLYSLKCDSAVSPAAHGVVQGAGRDPQPLEQRPWGLGRRQHINKVS